MEFKNNINLILFQSIFYYYSYCELLTFITNLLIIVFPLYIKTLIHTILICINDLFLNLFLLHIFKGKKIIYID